MEHTYRKRAEAFLKRHGKKRIWHGALTAMAAVVVFITSYMLILPAITLSQEPVCGLEAHTHTAQCNPLYDEETGGWIYSCGLEAHVHTDACYPQAEPEPVYYCGLDEHVHGADCYRDGLLLCLLTEHQHQESCKDPQAALIKPVQPQNGYVSGGDISSGEVSGNTVSGGNSGGVGRDIVAGSGMSGVNGSLPQGDGVEGGPEIAGSTRSRTIPDTVQKDEKPLPNVTVTGTGTVYDKNSDKYKTDVGFSFDIPTDQIWDEGTPGQYHDFYVDIPASITVPDDIYAGEELKQGLSQDGKGDIVYQFYYERREDGSHRVHIHFMEEYVASAGDHITGAWGFSGEVDGSGYQDDGSLKYDLSDNVHLTIDGSSISYPDESETHAYDINTSKSGEYCLEGNKLVYTVYVTSRKGTPDLVTLSDTLELPAGLSAKSVSVQSVTKKSYVKGQWGNEELRKESTLQPGSIQSGGYTFEEGGTSTGFQMTLPQLTMKENGSDGTEVQYTKEEYVIVYEYELNEVPAGANANLKNTVTAGSKRENVPGASVKDESNAWVSVSKDVLSKTGEYLADEGKIRWTITVNGNGSDICGYKLKDAMFADLTVEELKEALEPKDFAEVVEAENGEIYILFEEDPETPNENHHAYTITYTTGPSNPLGGGYESNHVELYDKNDGSIQGKDAGVNVPQKGSVDKKVEKASRPAEGSSTFEIQWKSTIEFPKEGLPAPNKPESAVEVQDIVPYLSDNVWDISQISHYMTWAQVQDVCENLLESEWFITGAQLDANDIKLKAYVYKSEQNCYVLETVSYSDMQARTDKESLRYVGFSFALTHGLSEEYTKSPLEITYSFTGDMGSDSSKTFNNQITVGGSSKNVSYTQYKDLVQKTDGQDRPGKTQVEVTRGADGEYYLEWKVKVVLTKDHTSLKIVDTLPEGVTLTGLYNNDIQPIAITEAGNITASGNLQGVQFTGKYDSTSRKVTLELTMGDGTRPDWFKEGKQFVVTLKCKLDQTEDMRAMLESDQPYIKEYENTVEVFVDGSSDPYGSSSQSQETTVKPPVEKKLVKNGEYITKEERLDYKVEINPDGADLVPGSDVLTLKDTLEYWWGTGFEAVRESMDLVQPSVKLYYAYKTEERREDGSAILDIDKTKGNQGEVSAEDWSWIYETKINSSDSEERYITATIPDGVSLILVYSYKVTMMQPYADQVDLHTRNTVVLEGVSEGQAGTNGNDKWEKVTEYAYGDTDKSYTLYKVDSSNMGNALNNAEFAVYQVSEDGTVTDTGRRYYSQSGRIQIKKKDEYNGEPYQENALYYVTETAAPLGYEKPEDPPKYYFYFSGSAGTKPVNVPEDAVDLSNESKVVYCANTRAPGYQFEKVDAKDHSIKLAGAVFTLYKYEGGSWQSDGKEYTTDETGRFTIQFQDQNEASDYQFDKDKLYKVVETKAPAGYQLPASAPEYYFYFSDNDNVPDGLPRGASVVNLAKKNASVTCENARIKIHFRYKVNKVDSVTTEKGLPGAQFALYEYRYDETGAGGYVNTGMVYTTDGEGYFTVNWEDTWSGGYKENTAYYLVEIKAPEGYVLPKEEERQKLYFYFKDADANAEAGVYPSDFSFESAVNLMEPVEAGKLEEYLTNPPVKESQVPNASIGYKDIDLEKKWKDPAGTEIQMKDVNEITFKLWRRVIPVDADGNDVADGLVTEEEVTEIPYVNTIKRENDWKATIEGLPAEKLSEDGSRIARYDYYIKELAVDGEPVENLEGVYRIEDGTLTICNQLLETYELPMTGGTGTRLYTLGGLFATALAGLLLYRKLRGKEERFSS